MNFKATPISNYKFIDAFIAVDVWRNILILFRYNRLHNSNIKEEEEAFDCISSNVNNNFVTY